MSLSEEKRALIEQGIADGKTPKEIAEGAGVSVTTVYNYKRQEVDEPAGVAPPNVETTGTGKARRISKKSRPITEETAGNLCGGIFAIAAMLDGPEWFLSPEERQALGVPLADSLRVLPAPIAEGVNLYSAPVVFVTTLSTIMYAKGKRRAMRGNRPPNPLRVVQPQTVVPSPPVTASSQTDMNLGAPSVQPSATPTVEVPSDILAAAAAAKGGLTGIDESDEASRTFGD